MLMFNEGVFFFFCTSFLVNYKYFPVAALTMVILFETNKVDHGLSQKTMDGPLFLTTGVTKGTLCQHHALQGTVTGLNTLIV